MTAPAREIVDQTPMDHRDIGLRAQDIQTGLQEVDLRGPASGRFDKTMLVGMAERLCIPVYGARPLKRTVQRLVLDPLALKVLQGEYTEGDTVLVDADGDRLVFHVGTRDPAGVA